MASVDEVLQVGVDPIGFAVAACVCKVQIYVSSNKDMCACSKISNASKSANFSQYAWKSVSIQ